MNLWGNSQSILVLQKEILIKFQNVSCVPAVGFEMAIEICFPTQERCLISPRARNSWHVLIQVCSFLLVSYVLVHQVFSQTLRSTSYSRSCFMQLGSGWCQPFHQCQNSECFTFWSVYASSHLAVRQRSWHPLAKRAKINESNHGVICQSSQLTT